MLLIADRWKSWRQPFMGLGTRLWVSGNLGARPRSPLAEELQKAALQLSLSRMASHLWDSLTFYLSQYLSCLVLSVTAWLLQR